MKYILDTVSNIRGTGQKAMAIKRTIEKGLKQYNFLQGNEAYKYHLGGCDFFVYTIKHAIPASEQNFVRLHS